jgi:hypothetical protein
MVAVSCIILLSDTRGVMETSFSSPANHTFAYREHKQMQLDCACLQLPL